MIPSVDDVKSSAMTHKMGDVFNPPGLTNFLGTVQTDPGITGITNLNFPPFSCSPVTTAACFLDGTYFPALGSPVSTTWYPDRIVRETRAGNLGLQSTTVLCVGKQALVQELRIRNMGSSARPVCIRLQLNSGITKETTPWLRPPVPGDPCGKVIADAERRALLFASSDATAFNMQGVFPRAHRMDERGVTVNLQLKPGEEKRIHYASVVGSSREQTEALYDSVVTGGETEIQHSRKDWNDELAAIFTPNSGRYSGFLPELVTSDTDILRTYHTGILGVVYFKRDSPHSVYGRAYDTLMPRYWQTVTFLWDYSLSSLVHALLDPAVARKYLETWMRLDTHKCFGTEYLTGCPVGPWYSVNDFAMVRIVHDYLRWTGDHAWVEKVISDADTGGGRSVSEYLESFALHWKEIKSDSGLADYGQINNLLECVSSYIHEVASLNGANVYAMRAVADILRMRGESAKSAALDDDAKALLTDLQQLYAVGQGYWSARYPDGTLREVRHAYDFITILNNLRDDLSERQKSEMCDFFTRELKTSTWMSALSRSDPDALFSLRPDHQWNGAYPAWPAQAVSALYAAGRVDEGFSWLKGLAKSANQGPFGQAHFIEEYIDAEAGGARKAANTEPYICDWTVSSGGSWVNIVVESIFGVNATLSGEISASPRFGEFDPDAKLVNLNYQGRTYEVNREGIKPK